MKTLVLFSLVSTFTLSAHAQQMMDTEAVAVLEKFLDDDQYFKDPSYKGSVQYKINSEHDVEFVNASHSHKENKPGFRIWMYKDGKEVNFHFGLNWWKDVSSQMVEVVSAPNKLTIKTSYSTLTLEKYDEGSFNQQVKSVTISYPNGTSYRAGDNRRYVYGGGTCGGALGHTVHNKNGVAISSNYSAPAAAPSFWSSVFH